jgi:hypothetical protein
VLPEKRDLPAVRRPEWIHGVFRARQDLGLQLVERAQPQHGFTLGILADEGELGAVGRDAHLQRQARRRRDGEADGALLRGGLTKVKPGEENGGDDGDGRDDPRDARRESGGCPCHLRWLQRSRIRNPAQLARQIGCRLPAIVRILGEAGSQHALQRAFGKVRKRRRLGGQNGRDQAGLASALEGAPSAEHFVEHGAESEDIGARIGFLALQLLRRTCSGRCPGSCPER